MSPETALGAASRLLAPLLKRSTPAGLAPVGSRLELRQAYLRHAQACAQYVLASGWLYEAGHHGRAVGKFAGPASLHEMMAASSGMLATLTEIRMCAEPDVRVLAETLAEAARTATAAPAKGRTAEDQVQDYYQAAADYMTLCRAELWYQVQWWQVTRRASRWRKKRAERKAAKQLASSTRGSLPA